MAMPRWAVAGVVMAAPFLAFSPGCDSDNPTPGSRQWQQEEKRLLDQRRQLEEVIRRETGGATQLTEEQEARVRPLWLELREVDFQLD